MSCIDANLAVEFFDGTLTDVASKQVESHAETCSTCRILLAELARSPTMAQLSPTVPAAEAGHIPLERGDKVGRFVVLNRIGSGGMGVVFSAYDPKLDRKVALKLLRSGRSSSADPGEAQTRLMREAQAMAQLSHPNVISVYDVGTISDEVYIAMELVEGTTLTGWLRKWERPWTDVLDKFVQAARALAAAHAAGLVHRDFKPDNVLVGNDERVRVMDFGLARWSLTEDTGPTDEEARLAAVVSELNRTLTRSGAILGTPRYMAPEQFLGRDTDARSDQFSFCVALYEALYGEYPFEGGSAQQLAETDKQAELAQPSKNVPMWVHQILERGLKRTAQARYPSMDVLLQSAVPIQSIAPRRRWIALAGVLGAAVVLLSLYLWESRSRMRDAQSDLDKAVLAQAAAEQKVRKLESELTQLSKKEVTLRARLKHSRHNRRELRKELRQTLTRIDELKIKLTDVTKPPPINKAGAVGTKPAGPRGLSKRQVFAALDKRMKPIKECFAEWRERHKDVDFTLSMTFTVVKTGGVLVVDTGGTKDKVLRECVSGFVQDTRFPEARLPTLVTYDLKTKGTILTPSLEVVGVTPTRKAQ